MMAPIGLTQITDLAAGSLVAAAWQGVLLAGVVAICLRMLPGISAAVRSAVWMAVLVVVAGLPFLHFGAGGAAGAPQVHVDERIGFALAAIWGFTALLRAVQLVRSALWLRGIARRAVPVAVDESVRALLGDISHGRRDVVGASLWRSPFARGAVLCVSEEVDRPSVVGFFVPRILVPRTLLGRLAASELEQIVLHEMEHLRRGDDWTNLLQKLSLVVFPLNPALIWIERQLCLERELACDDRVLRATGARKAYAACLANLAEHSLVRRGVSLALGAWERRPELVRRVHRILARPQGQMAHGRAGLAVAVLLAGVAAGADGLAHAPELVSFAPAVLVADASGAKAPLYIPASFKELKPHVNPEVRAQDVVYHPMAPVVKIKRTAGVRAAAKPAGTPMVDAVERASGGTPKPERIAADEDEPVVVMVTFRSVEGSTGAVIVRDSQFSYAAVPTRNGWLFVQL